MKTCEREHYCCGAAAPHQRLRLSESFKLLEEEPIRVSDTIWPRNSLLYSYEFQTVSDDTKNSKAQIPNKISLTFDIEPNFT